MPVAAIFRRGGRRFLFEARGLPATDVEVFDAEFELP